MIVTDKNLHCFGMKTLLKTGHYFDLDLPFGEFPYHQFPFQFDEYFHNPAEREYTATNCLTGKVEYLTDRGEDREHMAAIGKASSSLPGMSAVVMIDGIPYADGGVADSIPVRRAFEKGCDKVVVIETRRKSFRMKLTRGTRLVAKACRKQYPALADAMLERYKMYNKTLHFIHKKEAEGTVFSVRPTMQEVSRTETDYHKLSKFYHHGYQQMAEAFPALKAFMEE